MVRWILVGKIVSLLLLAQGCRQGSKPAITESYLPDPASVAFDLEPIESGGGSQRWLAVYRAGGKTARFRIELARPTATKYMAGIVIKPGEGSFAAESISDASILLVDLQKALEAKTLPKSARRSPSLGENMSQTPDTGFSADPRGNWTTTKIFVGEGDDEGQFFFNVNPAMKKGQFSIKDPDYGDVVLRELARVL